MRIRIVGRGRMGAALARRLAEAGHEALVTPGRVLVEPLGGSDDTDGSDGSAEVVLLAVPDTAIGEVAARMPRGPLVGHLSGLEPLAVLAPHEAFSVHPLMTVTGADATFAGAHAAVAGTTPRARNAAEWLAADLGLTSFDIAERDRAAYHAAASIAANFLVVLEGSAERLAETAGVPRAALVPLAEAALANWAAQGAPAALTGPIVRGDEGTLARQREAVAERLPADLALFDALTHATRALAHAERTP